ncbi:MAG: phage tail tape measure protein [Vampirovibrionales bacterium]|nr:phage tail tape measure protein [Vampirovibrionales bacterium]
MADLQSVVELIFRGVDQVSDTTQSVSNKLAALGEAGSTITAPLADATKSVLAFEASVITAGATVLGFAINEADKFDEAFREITTLVKEPIGNLQEFRTQILAYAADSTQSLDQVTKATYNAISQGISYQDSLKAVALAEKLAVGGKAELNDSLQFLVGTLNAYGQGIDQAEKYSDIFFTTVRLGKTTIPELSASIGGVTGVAANGGVAVEQLGAAIATLTSAGINTAEGFTALKATISAILAPGEQAKKLADDLGINFNEAGLKSLGFAGVLDQVKEKTGLSADKLKTLFGSTEAVNAVMILAGSNADKFKANLLEMSNVSGATQAAFDKMKDATSNLAQAFTVALIKIGDPLLDEFGAIEEALGELAKSFITSVDNDTFAPLVNVVKNNLGNIAELFSSVAKNLPEALSGVDFGEFADSLQILFNSISDLFNLKGLETTQGLQGAIQTIVDLLTRTTAYSSDAVKSLGPFVESLGSLIKFISEIDIGKIALIGEIGGYALAANIGFSALSGGLAVFNGLWPTVTAGMAAIKAEALLAAAALAGPAGLAAAVGTLSFVATKESGLGDKLNDILAIDFFAGYEGATIGTQISDLTDAIGNYFSTLEKKPPTIEPVKVPVDQFDGAISEIARYEQSIRDADKEYTDLVNFLAKPVPVSSWDGILAQLNKIDDKTKDANDSTKKYIGTLEGLPELKLPDNVKVEQYRTSVEGVVAVNGALVTSYSSLDGKTVKATGAFAAVSTSAEDNAKKVEKATKEADSFRIKMEEIASNERIKNIEAFVTLNVANLEAQTKQVEAAFSSINETISGTGDLLGSLFGSLGSADTYTKLQITEQIDLENKRREAALELQKQLTKATIEKIQAETRRIERGDALITVEAAGLEPHLEAIWFQIMKYIRVRVNSDAEQFLLGSV